MTMRGFLLWAAGGTGVVVVVSAGQIAVDPKFGVRGED